MLWRVALRSDPTFEIWGEAANGAEAIAALNAGCPDAIVLDMDMPLMDGLTALPLLRERCPAACVVMVPTSPAPEVRPDLLGRGASAVVDKHDTLNQLAGVLLIACGVDPEQL